MTKCNCGLSFTLTETDVKMWEPNDKLLTAELLEDAQHLGILTVNEMRARYNLEPLDSREGQSLHRYGK